DQQSSEGGGADRVVAGDRRRGVDRQQRGSRRQGGGDGGANRGAVPNDLARVQYRPRAFGVRHFGPELARARVQDVPLEGVGPALGFGSAVKVEEGQEAQAVPELVEQDGHQVDRVSVVVV